MQRLARSCVRVDVVDMLVVLLGMAGMQELVQILFADAVLNHLLQ